MHSQSPPPPGDELAVLARWQVFLTWLLPATGKFPRSVRFTLANRIDDLALDVAEDLVEARYEPRARAASLKRANLRLDKLRVLLRLAHDLQHLPHGAYEYASRRLDEAGRMLGGWARSLRGPEG